LEDMYTSWPLRPMIVNTGITAFKPALYTSTVPEALQ
jgi:hypothetical protein